MDRHLKYTNIPKNTLLETCSVITWTKIVKKKKQFMRNILILKIIETRNAHRAHPVFPSNDTNRGM